MKKQFLIVTSIFAPTKAIESFGKIPDYELIVVGDKKTPQNWASKGATFLSISDQKKLGYRINKILPYNHYSRKMTGYLKAVENQAQVIIDSDDDNLPKEKWGFPNFDGDYLTSPENMGFVNIYRNFSDINIWPRGFPLNLITAKESILKEDCLKKQKVAIGVWQGLADCDPDVDAIYRLTTNQLCYFSERQPIALGRGTACPFNSQNTAFRKELFSLLYLPSFVSFRFTDILRGLVAQPIMWQTGYKLGFLKATVVQERNPHNYLKDFESEIPFYLFSEKIVQLVTSCINPDKSISENLTKSYEVLSEDKIVAKRELSLLAAWLKDLEDLEN